jgi:PST family polysaccharide transporter
VLARLLAPADFGLVAVAVTAMQLLQIATEFGAREAVIRFRDAGRPEYDTLFTLSALRGALIAALLLTTAPLAARFYGDPRMAAIFAVVAAYPLLLGFLNPKFAEFERDLDLSREFWASAAAKLAGVVVSISLALAFRSAVAIALGLVAGGLAQLALSYALRPYAPRLSLAAYRKLVGFSGWLAGVGMLAALNNKLDAFVLARTIGVPMTGAYYVGRQLVELPTSEIAAPAARALYPGLSALQGDVERMRAAFLKGVEALAAIALPAALGLAFVADDFVPVVLGPRWTAAVPVVAALAPVIALETLLIATQGLATALGLTRLIFLRELIVFLLKAPAVILLSAAYGLAGAIAAVAAAGLAHSALNLALYARATERRFYEPLLAARRSLLACGVMALYFLLVRPALPALDALPQAATLAADIAAGAAVYLAALFAAWRLEGAPDGIESRALTFLRL